MVLVAMWYAVNAYLTVALAPLHIPVLGSALNESMSMFLYAFTLFPAVQGINAGVFFGAVFYALF